MAHVLFWEKPGCANNSRQKRWLRAAGHTVEARDLLNTVWTAARLRPFFGDLPVSEWFNSAAPAIRAGLIRPEALDAETALTLLVEQPLLIRRPLIQVGEECRVGFVAVEMIAWLGVCPLPASVDLEACVRAPLDAQAACP